MKPEMRLDDVFTLDALKSAEEAASKLQMGQVRGQCADWQRAIIETRAQVAEQALMSLRISLQIHAGWQTTTTTEQEGQMSEHAENLAALLMPEDGRVREFFIDMVGDGLLERCEASEEEHYHVTKKGRKVWTVLDELREAELTARAMVSIFDDYLNGN